MSTFPSDFDPQELEGGCLHRICFGVGTIHLQFEWLVTPKRPLKRERKAEIVVEAPIKFASPTITTLINVGDYLAIAQLGSLLNTEVTVASLIDSLSLRLEFGNAGVLTLEDDQSGYEWLQIYGIGTDMICL